MIFMLFGAATIAWSAWQLWRTWITRPWTAATGEIVELSYPIVGRGRFGRPVRRFNVRVRYDVGDRSFEGDRLDFGYDTKAIEAIGAAGLGAHVAVYYDPGNPRRAVLGRGIRILDVAGVLVGVALLLGGWFHVM